MRLDTMIKHIVMWKVEGGTPAIRTANAQRVKDAFDGLRGRISGMRRIEIGIDSSAVDYACDVVLVAEFDSAAALEAYGTHPDHLRVRRELDGLRTARHQVDYYVQPAIEDMLI